jgi:hypothetical protein
MTTLPSFARTPSKEGVEDRKALLHGVGRGDHLREEVFAVE